MLDVESIDKELKELDARYKQDRDDLLRAKAYALRKGGAAQSAMTELVAVISEWKPMSGKIPPLREGRKTDRQTIREVLAGWTGDFTIPELIAAAKRHPESDAAKIPQDVWSSTIFWLCQNRFVEVVKPRVGPKPGTYKVIVSRTDMITPRRRKNSDQSPLQDAVLQAIKNLTSVQFSKNDVIAEVRKTDPDRDSDVIGAVVHRLASHNVGARIFARSRNGNVYEKL